MKFLSTTHSKADWSSFTNHPLVPQTWEHRKELRKNSERQRTVDLPRNFFCFLNNLPNTGRCFVKKVAVQNCTENLSKNRSVVILKIKGLSSNKRQVLSDTNMLRYLWCRFGKWPGGRTRRKESEAWKGKEEGSRKDELQWEGQGNGEEHTFLAHAFLSAAKYKADSKEDMCVCVWGGGSQL